MRRLSLFVSIIFYSLICYGQASGQIITTIAGNGSQGYSGDGGPAMAAQLNDPFAIAIDAAGSIYIADWGNNRIRKVDPSGMISTVAGSGVLGYGGDGGVATAAQLYTPTGVAVDASGNLYIADNNNNRVRKVTSSGVISTVAGSGIQGYSGDGGIATAAKLKNPSGVMMDGAGNLYIADNGNNRIRKVTPSGIISTIAGNGTAGFSGDGGQATAAQLNNPAGVALDKFGNLYVADKENNRVRRINPSGIISTVAGTGSAGYGGDGGSATLAQLSGPYSLAIDANGNLYIGDYYNYRVRKVDVSGIISTVAGGGTSGLGDGGPATDAQLFLSPGVALDTAGNMYIADEYNNRIRKVVGVAATLIPTLKATDVSIYPNPASNIVYINAPEKVNYTICSIEGKLVQSGQNATSANIEQLANGLYMMTITDSDGHVIKVEKLAKMNGY